MEKQLQEDSFFQAPFTSWGTGLQCPRPALRLLSPLPNPRVQIRHRYLLPEPEAGALASVLLPDGGFLFCFWGTGTLIQFPSVSVVYTYILYVEMLPLNMNFQKRILLQALESTHHLLKDCYCDFKGHRLPPYKQLPFVWCCFKLKNDCFPPISKVNYTCGKMFKCCGKV